MGRCLPSYWLPHTVEVQEYKGVGGNGPIFEPKADLKRVYAEDVREVVVDAQGVEVVSNSRFYCDFDRAPVEESKVTVWPGTPFARETTVVRVSRYQHPMWPGFAEVRLK